MKTLNTLVVGLGRIGRDFHIPQIIKHDGFRLGGAVEPLAERRAEAQAEFSCPVYASIEEAFGDQQFDLTLIASPTVFHEDNALCAMAHGSDVFCDKPLAVGYESAERMIDGMKRFSKKLMVFQPRRVDSEVVALKDILDQGVLGEIFQVKMTWSAYSPRCDWQAFLKNGGGMLNNYGAHALDRFIYLFDEPVVKKYCALRKVLSPGDADDVAKVLLEMQSGMMFDLEINMAVSLSDDTFRIAGRYGTLEMTKDKKWHLKYCPSEEMPEYKLQNSMAAAGRTYGQGVAPIPWREEFISFENIEPIDFYEKCYEYFAEDKTPFVPVEQTLKLMRLNAELRAFAQNKENSDD